MSPAFPVVFVRNFLAVEVLCRYVFRTPLFTRTFLRVGTPSASKRFRAIASPEPSSYRVSCGDATFFPIFLPNGERPAMTVHAPSRPPVWSVRDPKMSGSNTTGYRPAFPGFGDRAKAAMRPAFRPAFSGLNWESRGARAIPCPLDSSDTSARIDRQRLARGSRAPAPLAVRRTGSASDV